MNGRAGTASKRSLPAEPPGSDRRRNPLALIVERAGGAATADYQRALRLEPEKCTEVPVFRGPNNEVERVTAYPRAEVDGVTLADRAVVCG